MTVRHTRKSHRTGNKSVSHVKRMRERTQQRKLLLESLEARRVMAVGPTIAGIQPDSGPLLVNNVVLSTSPRELNFKFTNAQDFGLDSTTLAGIQLLRSGFDGEFAVDSVLIKPGYIGLDNSTQQVVMRFADPLPNDTYRVVLVGAVTTATPVVLKDAAGNPYNGGANDMLQFKIDLGAKVLAVVPQPVDRAANGTITQRDNQVDVYFNEDKLNVASAQNVNFYQLLITNNTVSPTDDVASGVIMPTGAVYNAAANKVTLTFASSLTALNPNNYALRLRIGTDEAIDATTYTPIAANDPLSTFTGALQIGALTGNTVYTDSISAKPYDIQFPGGNDDPGHRDTPIDAEKHISDGAGDGTNGVTVRYYNFKNFLGSISDGRGGTQPAFNLITENQKQRAREVFELYSRYAGIQFVESQDQGITVATGDLRIADPTIPSAPNGVAGLGGGNLAIMDSAETWDDTYGGGYFQVAMHEIGHTLGLGHTYDLPPLTIQGEDGSLPGNSEAIFPGDNDIVHLQRLYRPEGQDIDMYKFTLPAGQKGTFSAETFAERLRSSSLLDTYLRLYQDGPDGPQLIAANDDYFSKDSLIQLQLSGGGTGATFYLGVSAKGNDQYDPAATDSGLGGTSEGEYRLGLNFRPDVSATRTIVDTTGTPLDGDSNGTAGGTYNFWFKTAPVIGTNQTSHTTPVTLFVDRAAVGGGNGSIAKPFNNIQTALNATIQGDIVRILGNGGADSSLATKGDNLAYQIGFDQINGAPLRDGSSLVVPKNVTVMVDADAIFQMRRARIQTGSTQVTASTDRSGGAFQVLGTPGHTVTFTSYNDTTIGKDENPLNTPVAKGDWGGIIFRDDQDRASGRFMWEEHGIFLNTVNFADIRYGGGQVNLDGGAVSVISPILMVDSRPTVSNNLITRSAEAAMSATPNSFEETNFHEPRYQREGAYAKSFNVDYGRVGPDIHGNQLVDPVTGDSNTINGLFVRAKTPAGSTLQELTVAGRFDDTDITHIISENLVIRGTPSGPTFEGGSPTASDPTITDGKPPINLVIVTQQAGNGALVLGQTYRYRVVYVDALGNEGRPSNIIGPVTINSANSSVQLSQLPTLPANSNFVARRIYRADSSNVFTFVDQVPSTDTTYLDRGATPTFIRYLDNASLTASNLRPRPDASLVIDSNVVVKLDASRIEVGFGATFVAEGRDGQEVVFTSLSDDRFGAGGTFDTRGDGALNPAATGQWSGIYASPNSRVSIDFASLLYGGGLSRVEGSFGSFNVIEDHQADVRVAHSLLQFNGDGLGSSNGGRTGRGSNATGSIYVLGSQPVIVNNIIRDNLGAAINVNANALNSTTVVDMGRQTGLINRLDGFLDNNGPLVRGNSLSNNGIAGQDGYNGMIVRGAILTTEGVWDDTDIAHILLSQISVTDFHTYGGLRLESAANESLVVKATGATAGFYVNGRPLETNDRIGGILQVLGQPGFPVIMTSLSDDTVSAGVSPDGSPLFDTNNDGTGDASGGLPTGPEVNNGTRIDNDVTPTSTPGYFTVTPGVGGSINTSGVTAQGNTQLFVNQDFIFAHLNYIDIGGDGQGQSLADPAFSTVTMQPTLISPDLVRTQGTFVAPNGVVNWTADTYLLNGDTKVYNKISLNSARALGNIRVINYLDEDVQGVSDDLLYLTGSPGQADFRAFTLDNAERIGFSQGGFYSPGANLVNASFDGFAADRYRALENAIQGAGTTYSLNGNINTTNLPSFSDPALGTVYGLADVTTAFAWTVDPAQTTAVVTSFLELVASDPATKGNPGDWNGIVIDKYSHDRNVATILEQEISNSASANSNGTPLASQYIGQLASDLKSGDENLRLGYTVHGNINNRSDVDVYSFNATAGTPVWIDIDRTSTALDSVVELIDSDGFVLARSNDSLAESQGTQGLFGLGRVMQATPPFQGRDFYSTNPRDAGMRVVLPGAAGATSEYFVRVRSNSGNLNTLAGGQTQGAYQLQLRLQEKDEFGGTVVRYADVRSAVNGIQVLGQPTHSPLSGEHSEIETSGNVNNSQGTAQNLGNLLNVDRGATSIAGVLSSGTDVDWYQFNLNIDKVQGFGETSDPTALLYSLIFDMDYADGLGRANTVLSLFNDQGQLILSSRDSNIADDQPAPLTPGSTTDLSRGSLGTADPYIGPAYLPAGLNGAVGTNNNSRTYYVAISSDAQLPTQWDQFFTRTPANTLVRFQPADSVQRVVEDHINAGTGNTAPRGTGAIADVQVLLNNNSTVPFNLGDVSLFVQRQSSRSGPTSDIVTVDPYTGAAETYVGSPSQDLGDIAFRNDEQLFGYSQGTRQGIVRDDNSGNYINVDTGNGAGTNLGDDGIVTDAFYPNGTNPPQLGISHDLGGGNRVGYGVQFNAIMFADLENDVTQELLAVGNRGDGGFNPTGNPSYYGKNLVYAMNPQTGASLVNGGPVVIPGNPDFYPSSALNTALEVGVIDTTVQGGPGGNVTGIANLNGTNYAIDDLGGLYTFTADLASNRGLGANNPFAVQGVNTTYVSSSQAELQGIKFQALTLGPQTVEGGRYKNLLFGVSDTGRLYAFNTAGQLQPIFADGATSMQLNYLGPNSLTPQPLDNVRGLAFSALDKNLWHITPTQNNVANINNQQQDAAGHGLVPTFDGGVKPATALAKQMEAVAGGSSFYFGDPNALTQNRLVKQTTGTAVNSYDAAGGAYGSIVSNEFSLKGYSPADQPVLYYNYFLDSAEVYDSDGTGRNSQDAVRVFVGGNDGKWTLVSGDQTEQYTSPSPTTGSPSPALGSRMWDSTGNWRQVRINLGDFAGDENLRLRFDFSTAGDMNVGDINTTGQELRAVAGKFINDGDTFTIDSQTYEFDSGVTIVTSPGSELQYGDTFTIKKNNVQTVFEFSPDGTVTTPTNVAIQVPGLATKTAAEIAVYIRDAVATTYGVTPQYLGDNRVNLSFLNNSATDGAIENSTGLTLEGNVGVAAANIPVSFNRSMTREQVAAQIDAVLEPVFTSESLAVVGTGADFNDGDSFTLTSGTFSRRFEFEKTGGVVGVNPPNSAANTTLVNVNNSDSAKQIAQAIYIAVNGYLQNNGGGRTAIAADQNRVQLDGLRTERFTLSKSPSNLSLRLDTPVDQVKTDRDLIHIIKHNVTDAGPLGLATSLPGDNVNDPLNEGFNSNTRGQNNNFQGVYVDDIVIGLAERGELITGATNDTNFVANQGLQPNQNVTGSYQLEIRRGADYALAGRQGPLYPVIKTDSTGTAVPASINSNARVDQSTSVIAPAGADIQDGKTLALSDGVNEVRFEFDFDGIVAPGNIAVPYSPDDTAAEVAASLRTAINSASAQAVLTVSAQIADGSTPGQFSTNSTVNIVGNATFQAIGMAVPEANDIRSTATPLNFAEQSTYVMNGTIGDNPALTGVDAGKDVDMFQTYLLANQQLYVDVDAAAGSTFNGYLRVFNETTPLGYTPATPLGVGNSAAAAPGETANGRDPYLTFTAPADGFYYVAVSGEGNSAYSANTGAGAVSGSTGQYRLEISKSIPSSSGTDIVQINNRPYGDMNLNREQGQLILEGNRISNNSQWGILVQNGTTDNGGATHLSPTRTLRQPNSLVPGVVIVNNIIYNNGSGGIRFSGGATTAGQEVSAVPFGRLINNTIFGKGGTLLQQPAGNDVGIQVDQNASPTLVNNIVANFATGVSVDQSSQSAGTVVGGSVYQGNVVNVIGTGGIESNAIVLTTSEKLFVDPSVGNFYLLPGSAAIDSSIDSLPDRGSLTSIRTQLGIGLSPILAPDTDASGQLRIDDPNAVTPGGAGENVFKDRGALDRSDFIGPTSFLTNPLDNNPTDGDASLSKVVLGSVSLSTFEIQLTDIGLGIDANSVISQAVTVEDSAGSGYRTLVPGTDYQFSYNPTNSTIILRPTSGVWAVGRNYRITLDNSITDGTPNVAIRDAAGNLLQPNRTDGTNTFDIFLGTAVDWGDAPSTYQVLSSANGASHQIRGNLRLGTNISADTDGQPSANATGDTFDDGLISNTISPGVQSTISVLAQGTGILDAWLDMNKDGIWQASEKLVFTNGNTVGGGVTKQLLFKFGTVNDVKGDTFLRLRYSTAGINTVTGPAPDGEVEDYKVTMFGPKYQNPNNRFDVDANGFIQSRDALLIVNLISKYDTDGNGVVNPNTDLPPALQTAPPYYDVNGDGLITRQDALLIVNKMNSSPIVASSPTSSSPTGTQYASSSVVYAPVTSSGTSTSSSTATGKTSAVDAVFAATGAGSTTASTPAKVTPVAPKPAVAAASPVAAKPVPATAAPVAAKTAPVVAVKPASAVVATVATPKVTAPIAAAVLAPKAPVISATAVAAAPVARASTPVTPAKPASPATVVKPAAAAVATLSAPLATAKTSTVSTTTDKKKDSAASSVDDFFSQY